MNDLVPTNPEPNLPAIAGLVSLGQGVFSTLSPTDPETRYDLAEAITGEALGVDDLGDPPIELAAIVVHPQTLVNEETGEVFEVQRTVLKTADGLWIAFCSGGIVRSLKTLLALWGPPPWNPPLKVKVQRIKTRRGRTTFALKAIR